MSSNLPPGVTQSMIDTQYENENTPCYCSHVLADHDEDTTKCEVDDCECKKFEAKTGPDEDALYEQAKDAELERDLKSIGETIDTS